MSSLGGDKDQALYLEESGNFLYSIGNFATQKLSSNQKGIFADHAFMADGNDAHAGYYYDYLPFHLGTDAEGADKAGRLVIDSRYVLNSNQKIDYAVKDKDGNISTWQAPYQSAKLRPDGRLEFFNIDPMGYVEPMITNMDGKRALVQGQQNEEDNKKNGTQKEAESQLDQIAKGIKGNSTVSRNQQLASLVDAWAFGTNAQGSPNEPDVHTVLKFGDGLASGQWLISTLQTPFSGTFSQDTRGLIVNNSLDRITVAANVKNQDDANPGGLYSNDLIIPAHSKLYFGENGNALYFNSVAIITPKDQSPEAFQYINFTSKDKAGNLQVTTVKTSQLVLTYNVGDDNKVHLSVVDTGTKFLNNTTTTWKLKPGTAPVEENAISQDRAFIPSVLPMFNTNGMSSGDLRLGGTFNTGVLSGLFDGQIQMDTSKDGMKESAAQAMNIQKIFGGTLTKKDIKSATFINQDEVVIKLNGNNDAYILNLNNGEIHSRSDLAAGQRKAKDLKTMVYLPNMAPFMDTVGFWGGPNSEEYYTTTLRKDGKTVVVGVNGNGAIAEGISNSERQRRAAENLVADLGRSVAAKDMYLLASIGRPVFAIFNFLRGNSNSPNPLSPDMQEKIQDTIEYGGIIGAHDPAEKNIKVYGVSLSAIHDARNFALVAMMLYSGGKATGLLGATEAVGVEGFIAKSMTSLGENLPVLELKGTQATIAGFATASLGTGIVGGLSNAFLLSNNEDGTTRSGNFWRGFGAGAILPLSLYLQSGGWARTVANQNLSAGVGAMGLGNTASVVMNNQFMTTKDQYLNAFVIGFGLNSFSGSMGNIFGKSSIIKSVFNPLAARTSTELVRNLSLSYGVFAGIPATVTFGNSLYHNGLSCPAQAML